MDALRFVTENRRWLGAGMLLTFCSGVGQTYFISIFAGQIRAEFGLSAGQWGAAYTAGTIASAGLMLWLGGLADRFALRRLAPMVLAGLAAGCLAMALLPAGWALPLALFVLRFCGQGMVFHLAMVGTARWFAASRGRALAIVGLGVAAGEAFLPLGFVTLMGWLPWRTLWLLAALIPALAIPLLLVLLRVERRPRGSIGPGDDQQAGLGGRQWTRADMLRHPLFWMVLPLFLSPPAFATVLFFHQVHLAAVKGWPLAGFVALFPLYTAGSVGGMLLGGMLVDRFGTARIMPFYQLPLVAGFVLIGLAGVLPLAALAMVMIAVSIGTHAALVQAFWAETYGTRHLGSIKSAATAAMVLGTALGPGISGLLIDTGLSFPEQTGGIAALVVAAILLASLGLHRAGLQRLRRR